MRVNFVLNIQQNELVNLVMTIELELKERYIGLAVFVIDNF